MPSLQETLLYPSGEEPGPGLYLLLLKYEIHPSGLCVRGLVPTQPGRGIRRGAGHFKRKHLAGGSRSLWACPWDSALQWSLPDSLWLLFGTCSHNHDLLPDLMPRTVDQLTLD